MIKTFVFLLTLPLIGQIISTGSGSQSVGLKSPTLITCTPPSLSVTCTAPTPPVNLPIEIYGPNGTTVSTIIDVPSFSGTPVLFLQTHGVRYASQASVKVNNSVWIPLSSGTLLGNALAYGGIGGGFSTISMTLPLATNVVTSGTNTITFQFNGTDGVSSGFRILAFNFQLNGTNLIPASSFVQTNPNTWTPPLNDPTDIATGKTLWQTANLEDPASGAMIPITAHCSDCHTLDGRDLKYFNYSNFTIETRATFHGLSVLQGQQIASYIRSLTTPNPGLPWNPPYQPGPNMDTVPIFSWSAGSGLTSVLNTDNQIQIPSMAASSYLNPRTTQLPLMYPDWNNWLPVIWPGDAYGTSFTNGLLVNYNNVRTTLSPGTAAAYKQAIQSTWSTWNTATGNFIVTVNSVAAPNWVAVNSIQQWKLVKQWEFNQDFNLESMASTIFPKPNNRAWYNNAAFGMEPAQLKIPRTGALMNGLLSTWTYMDNVWNFLQMTLNDGQGTQSANSPLDYGYLQGDVKDLSIASNTPAAMQALFILTKGLQENTLIGTGPEGGSLKGFSPTTTNPSLLANPSWASDWMGYTLSTQLTLSTQFIQAWYNQVSLYTPAQFYAGKDGGGRPWATATENCATDSVTTFGGMIWSSLPRWRTLGVNSNLMNSIYIFIAKVFPATNWAANKAIVCNATFSTCQ